MRTKYTLSKADEKCRITGALGVHGILAGAIITNTTNMDAFGILLCAAGIIAVIKAFAYLFKN